MPRKPHRAVELLHEAFRHQLAVEVALARVHRALRGKPLRLNVLALRAKAAHLGLSALLFELLDHLEPPPERARVGAWRLAQLRRFQREGR